MQYMSFRILEYFFLSVECNELDKLPLLFKQCECSHLGWVYSLYIAARAAGMCCAHSSNQGA